MPKLALPISILTYDHTPTPITIGGTPHLCIFSHHQQLTAFLRDIKNHAPNLITKAGHIDITPYTKKHSYQHLIIVLTTIPFELIAVDPIMEINSSYTHSYYTITKKGFIEYLTTCKNHAPH